MRIRAPFSLNTANPILRTALVSVPRSVQVVRLEIERCTSLTPTVWPDPATMVRVSIGVETNSGHRIAASVEFFGGISIPIKTGIELAVSHLSYVLPYIPADAALGRVRRDFGEDWNTLSLFAELELTAGIALDSFVIVEAT